MMIPILFLLAFPLFSQTSTASLDWSGPCAIGGAMQTCRVTLPIRIDPATRIGTLDLPAAPVTAAPACPGPFVARESAQVLVIGPAWSDATPCRIPQATATAAEVVLPRPVRLQIPPTGNCRGWVWVEKGAIMYSAGPGCAIPGAVGEVPSFGMHLLGYWSATGGNINMVHSAMVPELVHDTWTIQVLNAVRQAAMLPRPGAAVSGTVALGDGRVIRRDAIGEPARVAYEMPTGSEPMLPVTPRWTPAVSAAYQFAQFGECQPPAYTAACRAVQEEARKRAAGR